jgi:methyl-accepting chemotaxis protein
VASLPLLPFTLPARLVTQALDDLHAIAEAARRLPGIEAMLTEQFEVLNRQADQIIDLGERIIGQGERLHERGGAMLDQAERIDARAAALLEHSDRLHARSDEVLEESERVRAAAHEVAVRGAEVAAALPTLQQIATTTEPLQGAIERFGRLVDRLPGKDRPDA